MPGSREGRDLGPQPLVGRQLGAEDLGEAPGEEQGAGAGRELLVAQRVEGKELGARGLEQLQVLLVVEREGRPARDGDPRAGGRFPARRRAPGRRRWAGSPSRERQNGIEVGRASCRERV